MMNWIVGVDPGTKQHGVAFYRDGRLIRLAMLNTPQVLDELRVLGVVLVAVERVTHHKPVYGRNEQVNKRKHAKIANNVGMNQAAMIQLLQTLDHHGIRYITIPPTAGNWAKHRQQFERITGWEGSSNKDTRSAAFFGFIGMRYA